MRRALTIDENSYEPDHPDVARDLNNLAALLKDTNRLDEAEPLMRRVVEIFRDFGRSTGHEHPHMQSVLRNYRGLLVKMKRSEEEIAARMREVMP